VIRDINFDFLATFTRQTVDLIPDNTRRQRHTFSTSLVTTTREWLASRNTRDRKLKMEGQRHVHHHQDLKLKIIGGPIQCIDMVIILKNNNQQEFFRY
jgi:hypothetical protein